QARYGAQLVALDDQVVGRLLRVERGPGHLLGLTVGRQGQVGVGDLGNQAELGAALAFFLGEVLFQRCLAQVAHPAEEVELESRYAQGRGVNALGVGRVATTALLRDAGRQRGESV